MISVETNFLSAGECFVDRVIRGDVNRFQRMKGCQQKGGIVSNEDIRCTGRVLLEDNIKNVKELLVGAKGENHKGLFSSYQRLIRSARYLSEINEST